MYIKDSYTTFPKEVGEACDLVFHIALIPNHDTSTAPHHFAKDNFIPLHNLQVYRFPSRFEAFNVITIIDKTTIVVVVVLCIVQHIEGMKQILGRSRRFVIKTNGSKCPRETLGIDNP